MKELPIEPEDIISRLYGNSEYKRRNREFGSLKDVNKIYPDDESILYKIFSTRAKKTLGGCPCCERPFESYKKILRKQAYRCKCGYKIYPLKGTHLEHCRTSLKDIHTFFYELFCSKNGSPATWLERRTGKEYDTCRANLLKISDWMGYYNMSKEFTPGSTLQLDVVYPKCITGRGKYATNKRGLGSERTFATLVISESDVPEKDFHGITKAFHYDKTESKAVENLVKMYVKPKNHHTIFTDKGTEFEFLTYSGYMVHTVNHKSEDFKGKYTSEYIDESGAKATCTTNDVEGINTLIKTTIHRIYRAISPNYLQYYVDRVAFNQTNKSRNFFETFDELLSCLPGFNDSVPRNFKLKKRERLNKVAFNKAA